MKLARIKYSELNSRQKENYNFQKVAGELADYGYNCLRLNDDWQGADFLAVHVNGDDVLKVQLKGRFTIDQKYTGKGIYIAFLDEDDCYLYPHDEVMTQVLSLDKINNSKSWKQSQSYSWPYLSKWAKLMLTENRI